MWHLSVAESNRREEKRNAYVFTHTHTHTHVHIFIYSFARTQNSRYTKIQIIHRIFSVNREEKNIIIVLMYTIHLSIHRFHWFITNCQLYCSIICSPPHRYNQAIWVIVIFCLGKFSSYPEIWCFTKKRKYPIFICRFHSYPTTRRRVFASIRFDHHFIRFLVCEHCWQSYWLTVSIAYWPIALNKIAF